MLESATRNACISGKFNFHQICILIEAAFHDKVTSWMHRADKRHLHCSLGRTSAEFQINPQLAVEFAQSISM